MTKFLSVPEPPIAGDNHSFPVTGCAASRSDMMWE